MFRVVDVSYSYPDSKNFALKNVSFEIKKGDYCVVLGTNGSGKSTLARIMAGFLQPSSGKVELDENLLTGIVFQSPKEQVVSEIVSRDTAFGPENLGVEKAEVEQRVIESLSATDLLDKAMSSTNALSLGQTQKLAVSGILALHPELLILDEATSMLDPDSRKELLDFIDSSHRRGQTIVHITHDFNEALKATHVIVIEKGNLFFNGGRDEFLSEKNIIENLFGEPIPKNQNRAEKIGGEDVLVLKDLNFSYDGNSSTIENFNLSIKKGTLTAITGASGSGKSTILELSAGLLNPKSGKVFCEKRPSLALQDASSALFEAFAADDVAFGPKNLGKKGKELKNLVKNSMELAGLPFEQFADRGTFMLSGGEKRKLALAGIIALDSDVILFDEPTAGLDPKSRLNIMVQFRKLVESGKTVVFSTHRMDEADFADRHIKMQNGKIVGDSLETETESKSDEKIFGSDIAEKNLKESFEEKSKNQKLQYSESENRNLPEAKKLQGTGLLEKLRKTKIFGENPETHRKNPLQKVGAVPKYCIFLALFVLSLVFENVCASSFMVLLCVIYGICAAFPARRYLSSFLIILPWMIFFCAFQLLISVPAENDVVYFQLGWILVSKTKILACVNLVLHTFSAFCCVRVFIYSTSESEFLGGISGILKPLEMVKIPVRSVIVIVEIVFRFIPLLIEELCSIVKTQIVRGGLGEAKSLGSKIKILIPLFIPLIIQTVKRSEALADALTARKL
ncbi:MAG: energy-coupling factor transporter ATPase [Treponema sp.]|nr:energy-coupling factor transporter ATPase [Treponema sp.]